MIQHLLAIWSLVPLPFLNPACTSGNSPFMYWWNLAWRILSYTRILYHCTWPKELIIQSEQFPQIHSERSIRRIPEHSEAGCNMYICEVAFFFFFFGMNLYKSQQIGRDICDSLTVENDWLSYENRTPWEQRATWRNFKPGNRKRSYTRVGTFLTRRKSDREEENYLKGAAKAKALIQHHVCGELQALPFNQDVNKNEKHSGVLTQRWGDMWWRTCMLSILRPVGDHLNIINKSAI